MNRRGFLQSILAAGVAPYVVRSGVLMPVRVLSETPLIFSTAGNRSVSFADVLTVYQADAIHLTREGAELQASWVFDQHEYHRDREAFNRRLLFGDFLPLPILDA